MRTGGVHPPAEPETSRFPCKELPHMPGSLTTPEWRVLALSHPLILPSVLSSTSASGLRTFRGSMAGLCAPLPTLRRHPRRCRRMTRGQCGSLHLHCKRLSLSTLCRFRRRTDNVLSQSKVVHHFVRGAPRYHGALIRFSVR